MDNRQGSQALAVGSFLWRDSKVTLLDRRRPVGLHRGVLPGGKGLRVKLQNP